MFELVCMPPSVQICLHALTRDQEILMQGYQQCMIFVQMAFNDREEHVPTFTK